MKPNIFYSGLLLTLLVIFPANVITGLNYTHHAISDWLYQPKVWTNAKLQVLWSDGPDYNSLVLYVGAMKTLTTNCKKGSAALNDRGMVAWIDTDGQVYLFNGKTTKKISPETVHAWNLSINKRGQVVWDANDETEGRHIYLYNGRSTVKLTSSGVNSAPQISRRGKIAWIHADVVDGQMSDFEVYYYTGRKVLQLTDNDLQDDYLRMADNGKLAWLRYDPDGSEDSEVFLYNRREVKQLTDNEYNDSAVVISPKGHPFWIGWDGHDYEIFSFQDGNLWPLSNNTYEDTFHYYQASYRNYQHVNKRGYFAWNGWAGDVWPWEIFYFDGTNILRLTNNDTFDMYPLVSNNGLVVWTHFTGPYTQSGELHLYNDGNIQALTSDKPVNLHDVPLEITVRGEVIFSERNRITKEERIWMALPD